MQLNLESHRQRIGDDPFCQVLAGNGSLAGGHFFERFVLLLGAERVHPGKEQRTNGVQLMLDNFFFRPLVIFPCADDKFDLVCGFE